MTRGRSNRTRLATGGFTLYELMLTLAVAAVTLAIGVPTLSSIIAQNTLTANINELVAALNVARAEAVTRGRNVVVCRSANADSANPSCLNAAGDWAVGWVVFENLDNDSPPVIDAGEPVLKVWSGLHAGYTLDASAVLDPGISFDDMGNIGNNGEFVLCKGGDLSLARAISLFRTGDIAVVARNAAGVLTRLDGTTITSCTAL